MKRPWLPIVLAAVIFASLSLWGAIASEGFLEADACTHYLYARYAVGETHYLVNVWGRPFVTALYAIPATFFGRMGVRVTSLCCALLIATIAWRIARDLKFRWPALAFIFTLAQPLVFLHSFSELTELPFALLLSLAFWCYVRRQWLLMTILVAVLPTARPEGFGFIVLAALALVAHRRWWWLVILPLPLLIWSYAGWVVFGRPGDVHWFLWLKHEWPYAAKSAYASGSIFQFVAALPAIVGPMAFPFFVIGLWRSFLPSTRGTDIPVGAESAAPTGMSVPPFSRLLIAAIPLMILVVHSLLYWLGRMASNGELRYMLIVAPFWALLAAEGWEWTFKRFKWRAPHLLAGVAAMLPIALHFYYPVLPLRLTLDSHKARAVAEWYRDPAVCTHYPRIMASNPEVALFMGISHTDRGWTREWVKQVVDKAPPGTVLVWDPDYGMFNADANRVITLDEIRRAGWIEHPEIAEQFNDLGDGKEWHIFFSPVALFEKTN